MQYLARLICFLTNFLRILNKEAKEKTQESHLFYWCIDSGYS